MKSFFRKMSLSKKLLLGPAIVLIFLLGISFLSYLGISGQKSALTDIFTNRFKNYQESSKIMADVSKCHADVYKILSWSTAGYDKNKIVDLTKSIQASLTGNVEAINKVIKYKSLTQKEQKLFATSLEQLKAYQTAANGVLDVATSDQVIATMYMGTADDQFQKLKETLRELLSLEENLSQEKFDYSISDVNTKLTFFVFLLASAIILSIIFTLFISRAITAPIINVIDGLTDGANLVAMASSQVSLSSQTMSEGALQQAASVEETSSSLEEMAAMTKQNADSAIQAKALMADVQRIVATVNDHMTNMVKAISEVTRSSEETDKIVKTIDEIAFQTNLLALNAAVEAARAGEAGAGFAVVADEVRNLAMRAAEAAKNTSNMIENTIKVVKSSDNLTKLTQDAFKENIVIAGKVGQLVDEIASASQEQATGINQISKAVSEMDKVLQQNSTHTEESVATADELNSQAIDMKHFVDELAQVVEGHNHNAITRELVPHKQYSS